MVVYWCGKTGAATYVQSGQVQSCFTPSSPTPQSQRVSSSVRTQGGRHSSKTPSLASHFACCHGNHGRSVVPSVRPWSSTRCTTSWWTTGRGGRGVATAGPPVSPRSVLGAGVSVIIGFEFEIKTCKSKNHPHAQFQSDRYMQN